ncbi:MAG: penicillin-binding protein 2, partial [Alphaproteobacteria bacterium]|nr:penicillin-binding protein 2 [Alphaproteobacteria bacterium]
YVLNRLSVTTKGGQGGALEVARARILIVRAVFLVLYCVVAVRLFDVMIIQNINIDGEFGVPSPTHVDAQKQGVSAPWGDIVDRNDVLLATSLRTASLYADPKNILDPEASAKQLAVIFPETSYGVFLKKMQKNGRFIWLKRGVTPSDQAAILKIGEPGLGFRDENKRLYPQGDISAHIVGYGNLDGQGLMGLERSFQGALSGSLKGRALKTTLDIRIQHALRTEMQTSMEKFKAKGAAGIIMDAQAGEVLAMVSLPDFDPHAPTSSGKNAQFNRVTQGVYELGSVFKIFSTAAFLETQDNALTQTFDATKPLKRGRYTIRDFHAEKRVLTIPEIFMHSSNIGTALMGETIGGEELQRFYKKLGLLTKPDVAFSEVGKPLYPRPWRDINTLTASYGHGIAVSPMQLVTAVSAVVNGGYKVTPRFVLPENENTQTAIKEQIISSETSNVMKSLMKLVVTDGTAKKAAVEGYAVGGKTGTAEKPGKNGYDRKKLISSFVGAFPIDDPKYVLFVMLDEPKGIPETYGYATAGWTAAPIFSSVMKRIVSIEAIEPDLMKQNAQSGKQPVSNASYGDGL